MIRSFVASPFRADNAHTLERNIAYARECVTDSINRGESPIAPHLLYTQVLDDSEESDRRAGIECGMSWLDASNVLAVYEDYGVSWGMIEEIERAEEVGIDVEYRRILE